VFCLLVLHYYFDFLLQSFFNWHSVSDGGGALFPAVALLPVQTLIKADYVSHPVTIWARMWNPGRFE